MSGNQAPAPAADEDQSSSSDGGTDCNNIYTSSLNSTPTPPTCDDIDRWRYHIELEKFGQSLQAAAQAVFPNERRSRYTDVSVLMLSWEDEDPRLPVSEEIDKLKIIFRDVYHFDTEYWEIPSQRSHYKTNERVMDFVRLEDDSSTRLKIVYYAGHARLMETRALALTR
jgi:hypothetical protein